MSKTKDLNVRRSATDPQAMAIKDGLVLRDFQSELVDGTNAMRALQHYARELFSIRTEHLTVTQPDRLPEFSNQLHAEFRNVVEAAMRQSHYVHQYSSESIRARVTLVLKLTIRQRIDAAKLKLRANPREVRSEAKANTNLAKSLNTVRRYASLAESHSQLCSLLDEHQVPFPSTVRWGDTYRTWTAVYRSRSTKKKDKDDPKGVNVAAWFARNGITLKNGSRQRRNSVAP